MEMIFMQLYSLLESVTILNQYNEKDILIAGISYHSKNVKNNDVFVCIKGYKTDGHLYLEDAMKKGAKAAIVEDINLDIPIAQYQVKNSRVALAKLSACYYKYPADKMEMIGITATNGKTTTAFMTDAILRNEGLNTGLIGTINVKINGEFISSKLTTPESLDLQKYFSEMEEKNTSHVIMEVSSAAQEMNRVTTINYDIVSLHNIDREHIDTHGSFEAYVDVKTRLIKEASEASIAILNLDCKYAEGLIEQTKATPVTFSIEEEKGHLCVKNLDLSTGRAKFTVKVLQPIQTQNLIIEPMEFPIELAIPGLHSVSNSVVAILISMLNQVPIKTIQNSLKEFTGVNRRFEFIYEDDITVIDDHFANPGNIEVTLKTISLMNYNNLQMIYAVRGQRGAVVNKENAETFVKWAKKLDINELIVTKSISDVTEKDEVTEEELKAFTNVVEAENMQVILYDELDEAIYQGIEKTKQQDLLLLAGCQGMDKGAEIALKELRK